MDQLLRYRITIRLMELLRMQVPDRGQQEELNFSFSTDRGNCYFFGQISTSTSMWQTVNLTNTIDSVLIDNHTVKFNRSAWIGGWCGQNDNAWVSVIFSDQINQIIGHRTTIGPILAADRGSHWSLLFRQATDLVPIGARSFMVFVTITVIRGPSNDGSVDNISIYFYK